MTLKPDLNGEHPDAKGLLKSLHAKRDLTREEGARLLSLITHEETTDAQIAGLLTALAMKGETVEEIVGLAAGMRALSEKVATDQRILIDTAGTGSSAAKTFNVSTAAAFVIAGAGVAVAKHGARAATSASGSADVLGALGVRVDAPAENAAGCLADIGVCFMFAPLYHKATARVARVRRELGVRTIFNLLGPLTNPAGAPFQIIGVYRAELAERVARAAGALGAERVWVVHGDDGLDELTVEGETIVAEARGGDLFVFKLKPEDFGCGRHDLTLFRDGGDAEANARIIRGVLRGERRDAARDLVLVNAAAALYLCGVGATLREAARAAAESIDGGAAHDKLEKLIAATNR